MSTRKVSGAVRFRQGMLVCAVSAASGELRVAHGFVDLLGYDDKVALKTALGIVEGLEQRLWERFGTVKATKKRRRKT